jgi:hypothetical protein
MFRLRMRQALIAIVVLSTGLAVLPGMAKGSTQTFTGRVSDAMCGAKHSEAGNRPGRLRSYLRAERGELRSGRWRQVYTLKNIG